MNRWLLFLLLSVFATPVLAQDTDELVSMLLEFVADDDKDIRGVAYEQIRKDVKGSAATERLAAEIPKLSPAAQVGLISALADRNDPAAKPAIKNLANAKVPEVATAAIRALGKLGDSSDAQDFVAILAASNQKKRAAARTALTQLRGDDVAAEIVRLMQMSQVPQKVELIRVLTSRRALSTVPDLLALAKGNDPTLRAAAMTALGEIASSEHVGDMVQAILKAKLGNERNAAEKCVMFVCNRIEDPDERALPLISAMQDLGKTDRTALIQTLGRVGGEPAWKEVKKAIASRDRATHQAGIRGISNWPNASVAEDLMKIAKTDSHADHKRIARMSLLRIAPLPDGRSDSEKLQLLKSGMKLAANDKEKNYGIKRAAAIRIVETLRYVLPYLEQPKYAKEACKSIVELAHDRGLRDGNKSEFHAALDKVISQTKDPVLIDRANRYKNGQTWVRK